MKKLVVSALGNEIYLVNESSLKKQGVGQITNGKRQVMTDDAIKAVFQWFMGVIELNELSEYEVGFKGIPYKLKMYTLEESKEE